MVVLIQVAVNCLTLLPSDIVFAFQTSSALTSDPDLAAKIRFASAMGILLNYCAFAVTKYQSDIELFFFQILLDALLCQHLCLGSISSTIDPCFIQNAFQSIPTTENHN